MNGEKFEVSCNFEIKETFYPSTRINKIIDIKNSLNLIKKI